MSNNEVYDLTVFMPSIRTHLLERWYESLEKSCKKYSFNVVVCGPFFPPQSLLDRPNFQFIQDYGSPCRAAQIAGIATTGKVMYHIVDDSLFIEDAIDNELDIFFGLKDENIIYGMRYVEGFGYNGVVQPMTYWRACCNDYKDYPKESINPEWGQNCHFLMYSEVFKSVGGWDCEAFQYLNHACHDLSFRLQNNGFKWFDSKDIATKCSWCPGSVEHKPIAIAQCEFDHHRFREIWWNKPVDRFKIELNNWKNVPAIWTRRFKTGLEKSYYEMYG